MLIGVIAFAPPVIAAMASRYQAGGPVERAQLRWFVSAIVLTLATLVVMGVASIAGSGLGDAPLVAFGVAAAGPDRGRDRDPPVPAVGHRPHRQPHGGLGGDQRCLGRRRVHRRCPRDVDGARDSTQAPTLAVAASTLLAFALFQPLRRRVQHVVDRRFDRARIDAERTAGRFGARLRDEVAIDAIAADLRTTIDRSVRPSTQGLWLERLARGPDGRFVTMSERSSGRMHPMTAITRPFRRLAGQSVAGRGARRRSGDRGPSAEQPGVAVDIPETDPAVRLPPVRARSGRPHAARARLAGARGAAGRRGRPGGAPRDAGRAHRDAEPRARASPSRSTRPTTGGCSRRWPRRPRPPSASRSSSASRRPRPPSASATSRSSRSRS